MGNMDILVMLFVLAVMAFIGSVPILVYKIQTYEQEAFDRGFMIQCVGKTGYYWECE